MKKTICLFALALVLALTLFCMPGARAEGADTGAVRVLVFNDSNNNGECGEYETGVSGISVSLLAADGASVAEGESDGSGSLLFAGLAPGEYRLRATLPEDRGFNRKGKADGLKWSCMDLSGQGSMDSAPIQVRAGETAERGIGLMETLAVSGVCWLDENGDGIMTDNEPKLSGVRVAMTGQKNGLEYEAFSGEDGAWRIIRVKAGFYDLTGYTPDGMMFTRYSKTGGKNRSIFTAEGKSRQTKTLDTNDGLSVRDQNIGFCRSATVSGICWLDANYNGFYDEGEQPMSGVKVTAIKQLQDDEIAVAVSGEDGRYTLTGLRGNTYRIRALLPKDGSNFTVTGEDPLANHFVARDTRRENFWNNFILSDGEARQVNVGVIYYGSVSGHVYLDDNFTGAKEKNEKAVQGIPVTLKDRAGNVLETKKTNAKGGYSFEGLTPGVYSLTMTAKSGYAFTRPAEGNVMLNLNYGEGYTEPFEVPLGVQRSDMDAGMIRPASVTGTVFADENDNGVRDQGENGLAGTRVLLIGAEGEAFRTEIGEDGVFLFDAVLPGEYHLRYELPPDGVFAHTAKGGNTVEGENGTGDGAAFTLKTGDSVTAPLCGALTLGRISGTAFHDINGSGVMDPGEETVAGLTLQLVPEREDHEPASFTTGDDGAFEITGLRPDSWRFTLELPDAMVLSRTDHVTLPVTTGLGKQETVLEVPMGSVWTDQMLGAVAPAALTGRVWLDENLDGRFEEDEICPEGLIIEVQDELTGLTAVSLRTDAEGRFTAEGMIPGSFTVFYELGAHEEIAGKGDGTFADEGLILTMRGITLSEGEKRDGLSLGLIRYATLGGRVWLDTGDEVKDLPEAEVSLTDGDGKVLFSARTGEDGRYSFSRLLPGTYRITASLPEGCVAAEPDDERLQTGLVSVIMHPQGRTGSTDPIVLRMGADDEEMDIGSVRPGTIGDYCWLDENGNGWQDGIEYGIPGVRLELVRNGETKAETVTDQYGFYWFRDIYPAVYTIRVTPPAEVKPTLRKTDIPLIVSSLTETEEPVCYVENLAVGSDTVNFNVDLGFALRKKGVYPAGLGQGATIDWSKTYEPQGGDT